MSSPSSNAQHHPFKKSPMDSFRDTDKVQNEAPTSDEGSISSIDTTTAITLIVVLGVLATCFVLVSIFLFRCTLARQRQEKDAEYACKELSEHFSTDSSHGDDNPQEEQEEEQSKPQRQQPPVKIVKPSHKKTPKSYLLSSSAQEIIHSDSLDIVGKFHDLEQGSDDGSEHILFVFETGSKVSSSASVHLDDLDNVKSRKLGFDEDGNLKKKEEHSEAIHQIDSDASSSTSPLEEVHLGDSV